MTKKRKTKPARRPNKGARETFPVGLLSISIAAGQSLSDAVALAGKQLLALIAPDAWDEARLSFQLSPDGVNFYDVSMRDTDQTFSIPIVPTYWVPINTQVFPPNSIWIKIRSGTLTEPVEQSADRVFQLVTS